MSPLTEAIKRPINLGLDTEIVQNLEQMSKQAEFLKIILLFCQHINHGGGGVASWEAA